MLPSLPRTWPRQASPLGGLAAGPLFLLALCVGCAVPQRSGDGQMRRIVEPTTSRGYWLYLPKDYIATDGAREDGRRWPLVVTFHGMKPFDNARPQTREWQLEADRYGFVVIAPELRTFHMFGQFPLRTVSSAFQGDENAVLAILDHVFQTTRADPAHVLSTSWSSGGYMAHYMLNRHPDRFTCLAVRQSNFSDTVLDPALTSQSVYHPVLIINTENDFAICLRESKRAVQWYQTHGYKNDFWVHIKNGGHERTPDLAAYFFGLVANAQPTIPPKVLVRRQAIDGNEEGIAFLSGKMSDFQSPPVATVASRSQPRPIRATVTPQTFVTPAVRQSSVPSSRAPGPAAADTNGSRRAAAVPRRSTPRSPLKIRVSSAIGIEPLHLGFSAECPAHWRDSADFHWSLDGQPIGSGVNGQKTLADAGEHTLGVLVVTAQGEEFRAKRTIRVLPRLDSISSSAGQRSK